MPRHVRESVKYSRRYDGGGSWGTGKWGSGYADNQPRDERLTTFGHNEVRDILGGRDHESRKKLPKIKVHPKCEGKLGKSMRVCINTLTRAELRELDALRAGTTPPDPQALRAERAEVISRPRDLKEDRLTPAAMNAHRPRNYTPLGRTVR